MKKFLAILALTFMSATSVLASENVNVVVYGENIADKGVIVEGRTLVPVRGIFEKLGFNVSYDAETKTATADMGKSFVVTFRNGDDFYIINGKQIKADVPQQIIDGKFMIPLRQIQNIINVNIDWNGETKTATISKTGGISDLKISTESKLVLKED